MGQNSIEQLLVYVPAPKPMEDEEKQKDPFALYGACGAVFPSGDGDSYLVPVRKPIKNGGLFSQAGTDRDQIPAQEQIKSTFHAGLLKTQSKLTVFKYTKFSCKA